MERQNRIYEHHNNDAPSCDEKKTLLQIHTYIDPVVWTVEKRSDTSQTYPWDGTGKLFGKIINFLKIEKLEAVFSRWYLHVVYIDGNCIPCNL